MLYRNGKNVIAHNITSHVPSNKETSGKCMIFSPSSLRLLKNQPYP